jgi:hypothetical protein
MTVNFYASERHFIDHLAPLWHALPERGVFATPLTDHARSLGIEPAPLATGPTLVASYGDQKYVRRRGVTQIARMEHGIGQAYIGVTAGNYAGGQDCREVSLFLCPNEYSANRWRSAYPNADVAVIGSPKLDKLPASVPPFASSPVIATSTHFDYAIVPETRSAFGYFRKAFAELAKQYTVIGHAHPRTFARYAPVYRSMGIEPVEQLSEVIARASVYVCDNSSSLYEAATVMPVVVLNHPAYRRNVNHGLRFWSAADVGVQVDHPDHLSAAVTEALTDGPQRRAAREAALDVVYAYRDGKAAQRGALALMAWAGERVAVAA